jgi:hypothetical protein
MAVGFVCRDGVVIGADRQITGANYTFPECKLLSLSWKNGYGIFAYSGDYDTYQNFTKEIWARFTPEESFQRELIPDLIKQSLGALALQKKETLLILFGVMLDSDPFPRLYVSTTKLRVVEVHECDVIGYGDSPLARSLLGRFKDVPHRITVHQARIYAVDFISQAKKYDGQFVGDGIDVFSIDKSGPGGATCVRVLDAGQTGDWEQRIRLIHYWTDVLFSKLTDKDNPVSVEQFNERMNQFRDWCSPQDENVGSKHTAITLFPPIR